ncbi:MAG TPA: class I SAM-dependent RNA methyltransferase [Dissulfurispiraceae bacterium]|nr:class I SAM-dependent RNA methyltransferase [Dissulfurispiraceae bacterium]
MGSAIGKRGREDSSRLITVRAEKPVYGGVVIARYENQIVFLEGALPGEFIRARIIEERRDYLRARVVDILEASADRVPPDCPMYKICGGCHSQHIRYALQVSLKEEVLRDTLRRIGGMEIELAPSMIDSNPWHYRRRVQFKIGDNALGFYRAGARSVVDVDSCPVACSCINAFLAALRRQLAAAPQELFNLLSGIHVISDDHEALALFFCRPGNACSGDLLQRLCADSGISGFRALQGQNVIAQNGAERIMLPLGELAYEISPGSFFQGHWRLNQRVVDAVRDAVQPRSGMRILDLYAGAGNFSLPLAADAADVVAVEEHASAVADGIRNIELNRLERMHFVMSSAENYLPDGRFDTLVLDPPRPGLTRTVMEKILGLSPESIVYISCDPTTLARDLKKLAAGYQIVSVRMIDFFPQTYHIESMAVLHKMPTGR